jgi:hypothetical protein
MCRRSAPTLVSRARHIPPHAPVSQQVSRSSTHLALQTAPISLPHPSPLASPLSRPVEDCDGYPALAGARNLALDDPSAGRPDSHCNFATEPSGCVERRQARPRVHGVPSLELGSGAVEGGARPARRRRRSNGVFGDAVLALGALAWRTSTVQSALARESNQAAAERRRRWPHWPPGFVDRGGDQQEDGQVRGPNLMSAPAGHRQRRPRLPRTR